MDNERVTIVFFLNGPDILHVLFFVLFLKFLINKKQIHRKTSRYVHNARDDYVYV